MSINILLIIYNNRCCCVYGAIIVFLHYIRNSNVCSDTKSVLKWNYKIPYTNGRYCRQSDKSFFKDWFNPPDLRSIKYQNVDR